MNISKYIRQARKEMNMNQKELASKIGISDKAVSAWERDYSTPSIKVLSKVAKATNKPLSFFLVELEGGEENG